VELLKALGFEADLIAAGSAEDPQSHVAIVVRSDERNFVVDLGMFSIFAGPFELKVGNSQQLQVGKTTYFFEPLSDNSFLMRTFRNGEPGRVRQGKNDPVSLDFFSEAIKKSFAKDTAMMKALAIHRVLNSQPAYSWGNVAYIGDVRFEFSTFQDFESAICQKLKLPKYNLKRAYEVLISHGGEKLF
ncbi:MAG TPA: hypothetical protein VN132_10970, partial [Bdellovibrio sp.]|nr:hypothetical protein [Bdellovibrio sp.]